MSDLKKELAELKAERERRAEARDAEREEKRLAAQLARERQGIADDEMYAKLQDEHGRENLRRINTPLGMVVVTSPEPLVHRRFVDESARSDHPNPKVRTSFHDAAAKFARLAIVYPSKEKYDSITEKVPGLIAAAANAAYELGQPQVEEDAGK